ncbi:MAG TPA: prephenate dehydratase [Anaerolineae bacterium]|nr:prephenate dehydratase [Anaerolineae bacterium]
MSKIKNGKIGFLGPWGTYTQEALTKLLPISEEDLVPYTTEADVIKAVERGEVGKGMVAIENSIEGSVNATLDVLAFEANLFIEKEIVIPIHHSLMARPGVKLEEVKTVISHPQALAQCRQYLSEKLSHAKLEVASSNAGAAKIVSEKGGKLAAIGPSLAAEIYGLDVLDTGIEDFDDNQTRFVLVGKEPAARTGRDKTSIVCFIYEDRPGSLLLILQEFAYRYINLTKIQSRPTKKALGDYCFFIDMLGHIEDEVVASALKCLRCKIRGVKILGSYPMANGVEK